MLQKLVLKDVGPAPSLSIDLHPRLNVLTGDNGLGKSFLLDVSWWCLTRTWAREKIYPHRPPAEPTLKWSFKGRTGNSHSSKSSFDRQTEIWSGRQGRPAIPGMVIYAQVDGGFSLWDPARNYWKGDNPDRPPAFVFRPEEVWNGNELCEGLVRDWASWQREDNEAFSQLKAVLRGLSPSEDEPLQPGELQKVSINDPKRYPTLRMPYGQDVPVIFASAGMRRIIALAYLLVWAWVEHKATIELTGEKQAREIIFLIDEIEAHLHPQWQRLVVPSVLDVMEELTGAGDVAIQLIAATHSPLVLASTEVDFDPEKDAVWELNLEGQEVKLEEYQWHKQGDANSWLTSSIFDLRQARSLPAERALSRAQELLRMHGQPTPQEVKEVDEALARTLQDIDPFWVRWSAFAEEIRKQ